ncbi:telomere-protecting terminal protein Tpg [Streptomyces sp. NBC_01717]|uniref:telomere-protecting terminal protein Tpg n=1 Tax=Streptomyces sp. NBC_01717 TaxID=2975918 RepID=UPI002E37D03F|nr:XRE family transcriptional regulator [Streptomyces sp. NBC_01717]
MENPDQAALQPVPDDRNGPGRPRSPPRRKLGLPRMRKVERYVKDQIKKPRPDLAARLETEVKRRWQPQIRAKAREKAASTGGIVIDTRARLGYVAPIGSTDEDRVRHLTVALPPRHAARLFEAQEQGANDDRLREIAAEALKETYFQDGGRRAGSLEEVHFTDIEHLSSTCRSRTPNSPRARI